ncbi:MAG: alpha/beta hydrolase [Pseudomonadota bacterium]
MKKWIKRIAITFIGLVSLLTMIGFGLWMVARPESPEVPPIGEITFDLDDGSTLNGEFATLEVAENRNRPDSRSISIAYLRIKGDVDSAAPPMFLLAGGPGGSYMENMNGGGITEAIPVAYINMMRQFGDVIIPDLRGVHYSQPNYLCDGSVGSWPAVRSEEALRNVLTTSARACREKLVADGFDLEGYTVLQAAQDIVDLATHLGYEDFRVMGGSFGSHLAMTLMKYHPDRIDRAIVYGVEGYDHTYDNPAAVRETVTKISKMSADVWKAAGRQGDPLLALDTEVAASLEGDDNPSQLLPFELALFGMNGQGFSLYKRATMTSWPTYVAKLIDGGLTGQAFFFRNAGGLLLAPRGWSGAAVGLFDCASGLSKARRETMTQANSPLFNRMSFTYYDAICAGWNVPELPDSFREASPVMVPTLFVQGDMDFATPFSNATETMINFPESHLVVVGNGSHSAFFEALTETEEMPRVVTDWLNGKAPATNRINLPAVVFDTVVAKD